MLTFQIMLLKRLLPKTVNRAMNRVIQASGGERIPVLDMVYGGLGVTVFIGWGALEASKDVVRKAQVEFPRFWREVIEPDTSVDSATGMPKFDAGYSLGLDS